MMNGKKAAKRATPGNARALSALTRKLRAELGAPAVVSSPAELDAVAGDKWFAARRPDLAVFPASTEEVSVVLAQAQAAGVPVTTRGAGYGYVGGCVPQTGGIVLSTKRMNRILEINPRDFVARVQPGVLTGEIQTRARKKGLLYPPDPASLKDCSIGGNIATNAGGPRCLKYGVTRNYVLGLEVVLADGTVVRTGGRTHKNKTGFDLVGIFVGSEGLLGVVTEATLRLLPHPPARATASLFRALRGRGRTVFTALDAGPFLGAPWTMAGLAPLLPHLDLFLANEYELAALTLASGPAAVAALREKFFGHLVVKRGARGALWHPAGSGAKRGVPIAAPRVRAVNTVGAGDSFNGALLAALALGEPFPAALARAARTASRVVASGEGIVGLSRK